jgi:hypothetical protein
MATNTAVKPGSLWVQQKLENAHGSDLELRIEAR